VELSTRDRLICGHVEVARRIALKMARRCPSWIVRDDLVSAGMLGLIEAADRYDDSRGEPFLSFAEHRIRGAIRDELRRGDVMPRRARRLARQIATAIRELEQSGEPVNEQRIAAALGVSVERYRDGVANLARVELASIDHEVELVATDVAPDELAAERRALARVKAAFAHLAARDVTILGLHFIEGHTYHEIAEAMRITPSRVCQLLWRAIDRLRELLGPAERRAA
jgi:RNA polymerase sigma factor for flagellar operon FliA